MAHSIAPKPSRREMDMLLSTGERITMSLLCMALHQLGVESVSLTGSQCGIITNHRHNDAQVIEVRPFRVQDEMAEGKVVVVGGFQGVSYKRDITTLGRGGSDTSAAYFAARLQAEALEIWTDVSGMFTANPRLVKQARPIPLLSYEEAMELSFFGAKVISAKALTPLMSAGIPCEIKNTFAPEDIGTLIETENQNKDNIIRGITSIDKISVLSL